MKLAHIAIVVKDIAKSSIFYSEVLNCEIINNFNDNRLSFVYLQSGNQIIELLQYNSEDDKIRELGVIDHIAFTVEDIDKEICKLKKLNIELVFDSPRVISDGKRIMFFYGPDKERIEFIQER